VARCEDPGRQPPIGQPIANVQVHVLDAQGQHVPIGVPGELYIGGVGLARGYVNQPELTAARFVSDPFSGVPGARLYKTGDRVRILPSGELEFLGRFDTQVKLRGFRIELGEIETVLGQHPGVNAVAVVLHGESAASQQIVAYVIPRGDDGLSSAALKDFLRARLPDFMVPAAFVLMERFPVTPAGKVDRRALPAPDAGRPAVVHRAAPTGDLEQAIASIWRDVLQTEEVGADDNFFDIGGTSLLIARVHARLSAIQPSAISIVDMFQFPTVRALAARLAEGAAPDADVAAVVTEADAVRSGQQAAGALRLREQARRRRAGAEARTAE
jgi:hypothetical protein